MVVYAYCESIYRPDGVCDLGTCRREREKAHDISSQAYAHVNTCFGKGQRQMHSSYRSNSRHVMRLLRANSDAERWLSSTSNYTVSTLADPSARSMIVPVRANAPRTEEKSEEKSSYTDVADSASVNSTYYRQAYDRGLIVQ